MDITEVAKPKDRRPGHLARWLQSTPEQSRDTGMAMALICLLLAYFWELHRALPLGMALLVLTMARPQTFRPLAGVWFASSRMLGEVVSTVILSVLFFLLVTPIGLIRRLLGADTLQRKKWKQGAQSVFVVRSDVVQEKDLAHPY